MEQRRSERMILRRTAMVGAVTAAYFLLTADYGPNYPNPIKKAMESSQSFKDLVFQSGQEGQQHSKKEENSEPDGRK